MATWLFDFDGTLVDSMPTYASVMLRILDENNIAYERDLLKMITPLGYRDTAGYYVKLGVPMTQEAIVAKMTEYAVREYTFHVPAKCHVAETIRELKARGDDLNVLTASPHTMLDPCLKRLGLFDLFTNVWSCEDFGTTKSDPQIYLMAAQRLGTTVENCVFVDDNLTAVTTAKAAGMQTIAVYDALSEAFMVQMQETADQYVMDFSQIRTDCHR